MFFNKLRVIIILFTMIFLFGCISSSSTGDGDLSGIRQPSDSNTEKTYTTVKGKVTISDTSLSLLGIEVYFEQINSTSSQGTTEVDSNINRSASVEDYKYKVLTDMEGNFEIIDFECGVYNITFLKKNYSQKTLENITVDEANNFFQESIENPGKITGKVLYKDGTSKYGIKVYIDSNMVLTDDYGNFTYVLSPGNHEIIIDEFGYDRIIRTVNIESDKIYDIGQLILEKNYINPDLSVFRTKIISSYGLPVKNADVILYNSSNEYRQVTDNTGFLQFNNIVPGTYTLKVIDSYFGLTNVIDLSAGQLLELENIVVDNLNKYGQLNISVTRENLEAGDISFNIKDNFENNIIYTVKEESENNFILKGLVSGAYNVEIVSDKFQDSIFSVQIYNGQITSVEKELFVKRSSINGVFKDSQGNVVSTNFTFGENNYITDENGGFYISGLLAGDYTLYVDAFGFDEFVQNVNVETGVDKTLNFILNSTSIDGIDKKIVLNNKVSQIYSNSSRTLLVSKTGSTIFEFNFNTNEVNELYNYNGKINSILMEENNYFIVDGINNKIVCFDMNDNKIWEKDVGNDPFKAQSDINNIYVLSRGDNRLYKINKVDKSILVYECGFTPFDMALDNNKIFVADKYGNTVSIFDINSGLFSGTINGYIRPEKLFVKDDKLFILKESSSEVDVIKTSTLSKLSTLNNGLFPETIIFGDLRNYIITENKFSVVDNSLVLNRLCDIYNVIISGVQDYNNQKRLLFIDSIGDVIVYYCN